MIRFRFEGNERHPAPIAFIGLSHNNLDALKRGRPIRMKPNRPDDMLHLGVEVVIFAGSSEEEMTRELESHGFVPEGSADRVAKAQKAGRSVVLRARDG